MKKLLFIIALSMTFGAQAQFIQLNEDEETFITVWNDPTFTDRGAQWGAEITKELLGGWVSGGISVYPELKPYYADLVGSGGVNFHIANVKAIKYYAGGRIGWIHRGDGYSPHGLLGLVAGFDVKVTEDIRLGLRYWWDYRTDQDDQFLGDSDGFEPGVLDKTFGVDCTKCQENAAIVATIKI